MKKALSLFIFSLFCISEFVQATTLTESFTSSQNSDSNGGMVWNISRGELHPPLKVLNWNDGGNQTTAFDVGDGSHGAFILSRYAHFDSDGVLTSNVIEIDTDLYPDLNFTSLNLTAGYILRPKGSKPLVIRIQGDAVIDGTIDCSGADGSNAVSNISLQVSGATSRCGGGAGGASVLPTLAPDASNKGASGGTGVTGGAGGPIRLATGGQGGGGGGAFIKPFALGAFKPDPTNGDNSLGGAGGLAGNISRDDGFILDLDGAGSGGGGGSVFDDLGDVPNHSSGAGGGAGGGSLQIYLAGNLTLSATGNLFAKGGAGGSALGGLKGGGGGGGGGGSILVFAGGDIVFDGLVLASPGTGGATAGGDGGTGAWGRTFVVEKDGFAGGAVIEDPVSQLASPGDVRYETGVTYTLTSKAIDLGNTQPTILTLPMTVVNLGGSTLSYNLAFSHSSDLAALTNFNLDSTYLNLEVNRYARFKIQIDNLDAVNPVRIQDLSVTFTGHEQEEFNYITGCGAMKNQTPLSAHNLFYFLIPVLFFFSLRLKIRLRSH